MLSCVLTLAGSFAFDVSEILFNRQDVAMEPVHKFQSDNEKCK